MTQPTKFCTTTSTTKVAKVNKFVGRHHRHLREIDCSLAIVGGPATGAESGGKSIHWTCMWRQKVLHSGCCGWQHNYYSQQRKAGQANEHSTSLRCLLELTIQLLFQYLILSVSRCYDVFLWGPWQG